MLKLIYNKIAKRLYLLKINFIRGIIVEKKLRICGIPIINVCNGGKICLADNVTLDSDNYKYHLNMHSPVKLFADRPGATITIGSKTRIHGSCLHAYNSISVGKRCLIAANCQILDSNGHDLSFDNIENRINTSGDSKPITIEDDVWIGANSIVLPGVTIGKGTVIAAGSIVTKTIPAMCIAGGNPAQVIRTMQ